MIVLSRLKANTGLLPSTGSVFSVLNLANVILLDSGLNDIPISASGGAPEVVAGTAVPEPHSLHILIGLSTPLVRCTRRTSATGEIDGLARAGD
jgi:hypothetical protein